MTWCSLARALLAWATGLGIVWALQGCATDSATRHIAAMPEPTRAYPELGLRVAPLVALHLNDSNEIDIDPDRADLCTYPSRKLQDDLSRTTFPASTYT